MLNVISRKKQMEEQKICKNNKKLIIIFLFIFIIFLLIIYFFIRFNYNFSKTGHNMSNKKLEEIEEYILNISSYKAKVEVTVTSNKTVNRYVIEQECNEQKIKQIVIEPENIEGLEISYENNKLILRNTKLNISKVYEDYKYIANNYLDLITFIKEYKESVEQKNNEIKSYEENEKYVFEIRMNKEDDQFNNYIANKKLTIDKNTGKILSLEVEDTNQKEQVYILYNEIEITD